MISTLNDFLSKENLSLNKISNGFHELKLEQKLLTECIRIISQSKARFLNQVCLKADAKLFLKYFFYLHPQQILMLELETNNKELESMSRFFPILNLYEKNISSKYGIEFLNSIPLENPVDKPTEFNELKEEDFMIIPVGPVHAGVIEPGFFKITAIGEHIVNLKVNLDYLHRGIEDMITGHSIQEGLKLAENICGDSTVAYSLAFIQSAEKILNQQPNKRVLFTRTILLELERLYNHIGDIGALINDTGYAFAQAHLSVVKEKILQLNEKFFGHRFLKNNIQLNDAKVILNTDQLAELNIELKKLQKQYLHITNNVNDNPGVIERLKNTGVLNHATAKKLSLSGLVGRCSGIIFDSRKDYPFAAYSLIDFHIHAQKTGDVMARYKTRSSEIEESFNIIQQCIAITGETSKELENKDKYTKNFAFSLSESARGDIFVYLELDNEQKIKHCRFKDVSFHSWKALEYAVLKNIVPDFPLCNKSFNLAYAGNDL